MSSPSEPGPHAGRRFGVVVPLKQVAVAKSRLAPLGDLVRRELVVALLEDTVLAARDCRAVASVLVVSDDASVAFDLGRLGVAAIPDGRPGVLNETLVTGAAELLRRTPGVRPVALCGDLPALRAEDLEAVLEAAPAGRPSFVTDARGSGTTLYTAADLASFRPAFGPGSRLAHRDAGAVELPAPPGVRRDVDTPGDLRAAALLGVGPRTSSVATRLGLPGPGA